MSDLILPLKGVYFDEIRNGVKVEEFRLVTDYWRKRLEHRHYDRVVLMRGYPRADDHTRRIVKPWRGYTRRWICHPHFGPQSVEVFAIRVGS